MIAPQEYLPVLGATDLLRGGNITVDGTPWSGMWQEWNWDAWIKWQVDQLVAQGGNCVRLIGGVGGITDGLYTLPQYLARWEQFLDYTASIGVRAYPCGGGLAHWSTTTDAQAQDIYAAWGALVDQYDHVIGIDATNEAFGEGIVSAGRTEASVLTTLTALTTTLRGVTGKPISHSQVVLNAAGWSTPRSGRIYEISDFYDFHVYYTPTTPIADSQGFFGSWWANKPTVIGEIGINTTVDSTTRAARYTTARTLVEARPLMAGALNWAITDTVANSQADAYGLVDRTGTPRSDILTPFQAWPVSR